MQFVKNSASTLSHVLYVTLIVLLALSLAMSRDGSSGGTIRMAIITEDNVERLFIPGNELPTFWAGKEIISSTPTKKVPGEAVPIDVEA